MSQSCAYIQSLAIAAADEAARASARERWNAVAKPIGSLGLLEEAVERIAALTGNADVDIARRCVVVLCADNGVVSEGVSQSDAHVTAVVARRLAEGTSSVCRMGAPFGIDCVAVDMGMKERLGVPGLRERRIAAGTGNIAQGPAMTREQALRAIRTGVELVGELARDGYRLIATGEMGIGNTSTATAMACAYTGRSAAELVGRGAGLSDDALVRKGRAIERALEVNRPDSGDPLDVLAKLGGFDIAGLCGVFLGGAVHRVPVVVDGLISMVAAYTALCLREECRVALFASHLSAEPAARAMSKLLGMRPPIRAGMYLGEGTGAVCLVPLLDMALALYRDGSTFADYGMEAYEVSPR